VWATGLAARRPDGVTGDVLTLPEGFSRLAVATSVPGRRVAVIGAGFVGCETAATLSERHHVTLMDTAPGPLARLHPRLGEAARQVLDAAGVRFLGGCHVDGRAAGFVSTTTHGRQRADVVVAAAGVAGTVPSELGGGRSLDTDERLRVLGADAAWACGDLAAFPHPRFGRLVVPHWDNARASGIHAAESVFGSAAPYRRDPYWFSDIGPLRIQQLGVPEPVVEWVSRGDLHVGLGVDGRAACAQLVNAPTRLGEARALLAA
jgi:3-phenylpropionate/trans-cinnamate dioxygenase ferredoxin reductase subunit